MLMMLAIAALFFSVGIAAPMAARPSCLKLLDSNVATQPMSQNTQSTQHGFLVDRVSTILLYCVFFLTGTAVVLPGSLLPLLSRSWQMGDGKAGVLFLCFSAGSSGGALLARGNLSRTLAAGCAMVAAGGMLLAHHVLGAPLVFITLYGCGLGASMTSISLLQSRRWPEHRIAEFARLNLIWAVGASCGPAVLLRAATAFGTTKVLLAMSGTFLVLAGLALLVVRDVSVTEESSTRVRWMDSLRAMPLALLCLIALATGVESGVNSWISSYMMRGGYVLGVTISATTAFGVGIVVSRLWHSRRIAGTGSARVIMSLHPVLMIVGIALLIFSRWPLLSVATAFLAGAGVGPMYPLTLALQLSHKRAGNAGFLAGGTGASIVPMIIGAVASYTHSLRAGLCVPLVASVMIYTLGSRISSTERTTD